jgi:hypothetical protein
MFEVYDVSLIGFASAYWYKRINYPTLLAPLERATIGHWKTESSKHYIYASHIKSNVAGHVCCLEVFSVPTDYNRISFFT